MLCPYEWSVFYAIENCYKWIASYFRLGHVKDLDKGCRRSETYTLLQATIDAIYTSKYLINQLTLIRLFFYLSEIN